MPVLGDGGGCQCSRGWQWCGRLGVVSVLARLAVVWSLGGLSACLPSPSRYVAAPASSLAGGLPVIRCAGSAAPRLHRAPATPDTRPPAGVRARAGREAAAAAVSRRRRRRAQAVWQVGGAQLGAFSRWHGRSAGRRLTGARRPAHAAGSPNPLRAPSLQRPPARRRPRHAGGRRSARGPRQAVAPEVGVRGRAGMGITIRWRRGFVEGQAWGGAFPRTRKGGCVSRLVHLTSRMRSSREQPGSLDVSNEVVA